MITIDPVEDQLLEVVGPSLEVESCPRPFQVVEWTCEHQGSDTAEEVRSASFSVQNFKLYLNRQRLEPFISRTSVSPLFAPYFSHQ